ncbi:MAG TPA: nicotinate-nucleotide--dimethylbenzimidazole phosphoribosyltransferase, partial [Nitrospiria bacterium]|nr:nicotinate-nucleotide--dimethylbenzimidazole phosphoribosyltransferase [Nitrospiria bacterium]
MNQTRLKKIVSEIQPVEKKRLDAVYRRLDNLTKPIGSLGRLEETAARYVAMTGKEAPKIERKVIYVFAADHGVTEEGVSAYPKEVTAQMVYNFLRGGAGINVLARHVRAQVRVVDIGVDHRFDGTLPGLLNRKVASGTKNMAKGPAMSRDELMRALDVGIDLAEEAALERIDLIGVGEMGIGNTTPSSAITAALTNTPIKRVTGRGTGVDDRVFRKKIETIARSIRVNRPDSKNPLDVLRKVGGLEIAGIAGLIIGASAKKIPVVIDGFISTAGALIAVALKEEVKDYLFASHRSVEAGHRVLLR